MIFHAPLKICGWIITVRDRWLGLKLYLKKSTIHELVGKDYCEIIVAAKIWANKELWWGNNCPKIIARAEGLLKNIIK
jgi:hypothetical protein